MLVEMLASLEFEVVEASDGRQAIRLAHEARPDLILMDRWMPGVDGFEAAREIRREPDLERMAIIAVSASVSREDQAQSREAGIDAFLPKPINWPNLAALLEEHLGLAWTYKGRGEVGMYASSDLPSSRPFASPPDEELAILHDLAKRGNLRAIRERATHLQTLGKEYAPFADKLRELAEGFEERQILALVERYIQEK
jgi:CheY-like chemotaxis protein